MEISKNISLWVDTAVRILQDTGDFDAFFSSMVEFYEDLKRTYNHDDQRVHPFVLLTPLTDLIEEEWPEGNTAIIRGAEKLGITPHPNYNGKRLRATNVLAEILVKSKL